ncbi:hypothetical protein EDD21DRAFT_355145 [Dissophora ornata]|nr:hypothetical protein EDD21DRAFT_355145 [Dissophora ornata]
MSPRLFLVTRSLAVFLESLTLSASNESSDSRRYISVEWQAKFHNTKGKFKEVVKKPSQSSTPRQYFFSRHSLPTQSNTDSQSASVSVSACMSTSTSTTQSTVETPSTMALEDVVSGVGIVLDVRSMTAAYKIANDEGREISDKRAYDIIKQFGESPVTFDTMQELVALADTQNRDIFLHVITMILHVTSIPLQGLAVILNSFPDKIDLGSLHGTFVEILKALQTRLKGIHTTHNIGQLLPLLIALNSLLDAMVRREVFRLDRVSIYDDLKNQLSSLTSHSNVMVCFQALYAKQALATIGNNESLSMSAFRRGKLVVAAAGNIATIALKFDVSKAEPAYQKIKKIFEFSIRDPWYQGLIYVDYLVGQHRWEQFEDFVLLSKFQSNVFFQLGLGGLPATTGHPGSEERGVAQKEGLDPAGPAASSEIF